MGAKVNELCRRHGISDATLYTCHIWRSKYGGLKLSEVRRLRQLEDENRRLTPIEFANQQGDWPLELAGCNI
jgi:transposase-like protein